MGPRTSWITPAGDLHNLVVGYNRERWSVRLRVENAFDEIDIYANVFETAVGVTDPRTFRLQFDYRF